MSAFDQLHPALQHHIVNSLGWRSLRPFQEQCIQTILAGEHVLVLAPTAGGKTEAASFPILSRMLSAGWTGLSVLYVCPLRALLNNLDVRLRHYCSLIGRRSGIWHGDTSASTRKKILADPPDLLLTTPESLEVMLTSPRVDRRALFANVRAVIVDEIHAFAGDDRGWHLLSVLDRIARLAGRELQRVGLSATVGNPEQLLSWLAGSCQGKRQVILPPQNHVACADVRLDYVGSLANAAVVISRLHAGQKRLVFCDSRARVEELAGYLQQAGVKTYVTHSSLSQEQRLQAESAFASESNCVIVATSALELGIDVGDLDRVIQVDAPATVSGFLQRMGRTGRRAGTKRNCLLLATSPEALVRAGGLLHLWSGGYVEPIAPPPSPFHILAQQVMSLALQERGISRDGWRDWIGSMPAFAAMDEQDVRAILKHMVDEQILWDDNGLLWFGRKGEETFGYRNFMELVSVFTSPPLFAVRYGSQEIGSVHQLSFVVYGDERPVLSLAGHSWVVTRIDWVKRVAYVQPAPGQAGRSRWLGGGQALSYALCQAVQEVLAVDTESAYLSRRAREELRTIRAEFCWVDTKATALVSCSSGTTRWWTFAGLLANAVIGQYLRDAGMAETKWDNLAVAVGGAASPAQLQQAIMLATRQIAEKGTPPVESAALDGLKFSACLPPELGRHLLEQRLSDDVAVRAIASKPVKYVVLP